MGHYSWPVSGSERRTVPTEMGEGREPGAGQGSMDEGGGQFSLMSHPYYLENLSRISSVFDLAVNIYV